MVRVRVMKPDGLQWKTMQEVVSPELAATLSESELESRMAHHHRDPDGRGPQLSEIEYQPNAIVDIHAHDEDECIYVLEGEMLVGSRAIGPGSSIYIARNTLYGFSAGSQGLRMLIFRPRGPAAYIELCQYRRLKQE